MAASDTSIWHQDMQDYMEDYFGTQDWYSSATTQSGIDRMIGDLEMMARGISLNLNYITDIERDLTASGIEITNTYDLFRETNWWAASENTNYSAVLLAEITRILLKREPVLQLKNWFDISMEQAEVLWKTITIYHENTNLGDAYRMASEARRLELEELSDINLEGEEI